jgi:hypothetical protein
MHLISMRNDTRVMDETGISSHVAGKEREQRKNVGGDRQIEMSTYNIWKSLII